MNACAPEKSESTAVMLEQVEQSTAPAADQRSDSGAFPAARNCPDSGAECSGRRHCENQVTG